MVRRLVRKSQQALTSGLDLCHRGAMTTEAAGAAPVQVAAHQGRDPRRGPRAVRAAGVRPRQHPVHRCPGVRRPGPGDEVLHEQGGAVRRRGRRRPDAPGPLRSGRRGPRRPAHPALPRALGGGPERRRTPDPAAVGGDQRAGRRAPAVGVRRAGRGGAGRGWPHPARRSGGRRWSRASCSAWRSPATCCGCPASRPAAWTTWSRTSRRTSSATSPASSPEPTDRTATVIRALRRRSRRPSSWSGTRGGITATVVGLLVENSPDAVEQPWTSPCAPSATSSPRCSGVP